MSQLRVTAVTKRKRAPRLVPCPACRGARETRDVLVTQRDGRQTPGVSYARVDCETCNSTGMVRPDLAPACCCSGPKEARCLNCANAGRRGSEIHVCLVPSADEIAFEQELVFMASPKTSKSAAGRNSTAADMGSGWRSGQR